jgi:hypothetical protein
LRSINPTQGGNMRAWGKMLVAAVAPLLLAGCLWTPG